MFKSSDFINKELCGVRYSFSELSSSKNKNYYNGIALKEIFSNFGFNYTKAELKKIISDKVPKDIFNTKLEGSLNKELLAGKLMRYKKYEKKRAIKRTVLKNADKCEITVEGTDISVDFHLIVDNNTDNTIEVIKFRNKKNPLKAKGRTISTKISENMELFLLQKAGEALFPSKKVYATLVFLSSKTDKADILSPEFNEKENDNVVTFRFDSVDEINMLNRISKVSTIDNHNKCGNNCDSCECVNICNYVDNDMSYLQEIPVSAKAGKVTFTPLQRKFISFEQGNCVVLAGAGSGKTTVIANRVATLLKNGAFPSQLLLVTYTTKGVEELKEKIDYWLKFYKIECNVDELNIFTFNGFGYELIKQEYKNLGFKKEPQVLDKVTKINILKRLLDTVPQIEGFNYVYPVMDLFNAKGAVIQTGIILDAIKSQSYIYPEDVMDEFNLSEDVAITMLKLSKQFNEKCKELNLIDFSDQEQLLYTILSDKNNLKKYGFNHVFVDEFQDSSILQINILVKLSQCPYFKSLVVVGDDSQSIFSWRGATQDNIINFDKYFKNVQTIALEENFRSTQEICALANEINDINLKKVDKKLINNTHGNTPTLITGDISSLIEQVKADIQTGASPSDICIISRNKRELLQMQKKLHELNIPSILALSEKIIENDRVKNIIGYSNFLCDSSLNLHFAEYLQVTDFKNFSKAKDSNTLSGYINNKKDAFLKEYMQCKYPIDKVNFFYSTLEEVAKKDRAVKRLFEILKEQKFKSVYLLRDYLNNLIKYNSDIFVEKNETHYDAVTITTVHSSKGREFNNVYVYLDSFKYPSKLDDSNRNTPAMEEERKLLFVAVTRAKKEVTLIGRQHSSVFLELQEIFKKLSFMLKVS